MQTAGAVALVVIVGAVLVPIATTYSVPFTVQPAHLPAWFTHDARHLSEGTRLVAIPYSPVALASQATAYQAEDSLRFDLAGGYALVPAADGKSAMLQPLRGTPRILQDLSVSSLLGGSEPARSPQLLSEVRASLRQWGTQVFVVVQPNNAPIVLQYDSAYAVSYMTAVYGRGPVEQDGAWVWYGKP